MKRIFDEESIELNRRAVLSERQKRLLWWDITGTLIANTFAYIFMVGIAKNSELGTAFILLASVGYLLVTVGIVNSKIHDIRCSSVYMITGEIRKFVRLNRNPIKTYIEIQDRSPLNVSDAIFSHLLNKGKYRFYLTEYGNRVLNFESLDHNIETLDNPLDLKFLFYRVVKFATSWGLALVIIASLIVYNWTQYTSSH